MSVTDPIGEGGAEGWRGKGRVEGMGADHNPKFVWLLRNALDWLILVFTLSFQFG